VTQRLLLLTKGQWGKTMEKYISNCCLTWSK